VTESERKIVGEALYIVGAAVAVWVVLILWGAL
jgi:hypothetical protein